MNEFINKLICRLEEINYNDVQMVVSVVLEKYGFPKESVVQDEIWDELDGLYTSKTAIEIVNELAEEYNGGWIPCSERLPDKSGNYIVCNKHSEIWVANWFNNTWWGIEKRCRWGNIIAWQPLPEPYCEKS